MTPATMTAEQLAEGRALLEKATPGPVGGHGQYIVSDNAPRRTVALFPSGGGSYHGVKDAAQARANRAFVVWWYNHAAALLAPKDAERLLREARALLSPFYFTTAEHAKLIDAIDQHLSATTGGERGGV